MSTAIEELAEQVRTRRALPEPGVRRALRVAAGATLAEVARAVGVTPQAVALWESGTNTPRGEHLSHYVAVLGIFRGGGGP